MRMPSLAARSHLLAFILVCALLIPTAAPARAVGPPERVRVLISFDGRPGAAEEALVRGAGGSSRYTYTIVDAIAASVPEAALAGLRARPRVRLVEPDLPMHAMEVYDIELDNAWGVKRIGAGDVHEKSGNKGHDVSIAIIDSGVDYLHPDLDENYRGGWDFVADDADPMDVYGHGTHVAGTACAEDNDNGTLDGPYGVVGVAPECDLYALRVLNDAGWGNSSELIAALQWAVDHGIQVANLSLGWDQNPGELVAQAFAAAETAGMVIVAAACNNGTRSGRGETVCWPAKYPSVIAVAATDNADRRATFSSTGAEVELAAPGVSVFSTWNDDSSYSDPQPVCRAEENMTACYKFGSGTSMASPHVAGVAALVIAAGIASGDPLTNDEVRQRLIDTATDLGAAGWDPQYGYGLVNAYAAASLTPAVTYSVSGMVMTDDVVSEAIAGATVSIANLSTFTDDNGWYAISGVAAGTYDMAVSAEGYAPQTRFVDVAGDTTENWTLKRQTAQTLTVGGITITEVRRGARVDLLVTVMIQDGDDAGVPGASVSMTLVSAGTALSFAGITGADGEVTFTAKKVAAGTYEATVTGVSCPGYLWDAVLVTKGYTVG